VTTRSNGGRHASATGTGGASATGTGGASATGTGGANATGTGGASATGTGGASATGTGGANATGTGGASATGTGGASATGTGGANGTGNRGTNGTGTGGASATGNRGTNAIGNANTSAGAKYANGNRTHAGTRRNGARRTTSMPFGHVAITGAAGAIGAALARAMREAWPTATLALVDRERGPLDRLAGELTTSTGDATVHVVDLRDLDALPRLVDAIESHGPLDGLVNCAGVMKVQQLQSWRWDDASALLVVDLLAPLRLQDLLARRMVERHRGLIINVASMAGRVPLRGAAYYGASKAGLAMASEIARADLAPHGVQVVTVYPGPVKSALEAGARADYGGGGLFGRLVPTGDPAELARRIMHAIAHDEPRVIYPRLYGVGWTAPNLSSWITLSYGPPPIT
jgi:uncharacterized protein